MYRASIKVCGLILSLNVSQAVYPNRVRTPLKTPVEILSSIILMKNIEKTQNIMPDGLLLLGSYSQNQLFHIRGEITRDTQNLNSLYSIGGSYRTIVGSHMLGGYVFLDTVLINSQTLSNTHSINLANLNLGVEWRFLSNSQMSMNAYLPLLGDEHTAKKEYTVIRINDKECILSCNNSKLGGDINYGYTFLPNQSPFTVNIGGYYFWYTPTLLYSKLHFSEAGLRVKLIHQWNNYVSIYGQINKDNIRPWYRSFGIQLKCVSPNAYSLKHKAILSPPIERNLSPLLMPKVKNTMIPSDPDIELAKQSWCKVHLTPNNGFSAEEIRAIDEVKNILWNKYKLKLFDLIDKERSKKNTNAIRIPRKVNLAIHPDQNGIQDPNNQLTVQQRSEYFKASWERLVQDYSNFYNDLIKIDQ